mgnify:FL=1
MNIPRAGSMTVFAFRQLRECGKADFEQRADPPRNARAVTCRVCRASVKKGEAFGYDEYMTDGYRFSRRYVCAACESATIDSKGATK